jgi:hypothetical protein
MYRFQLTRCFVVFCALASLLLLAPAGSTAAPSEISLLEPASAHAAAPAVPKTVSTTLVARMRTVDINPDILTVQTIDAMQLNLFEDAQYRAVRVRSQKGTEGMLLWTGTISGAENGHAVIVAKDRMVYASIVFASTTYQIRPFGQGLHMLRQIKKEALTGIASVPSAVGPIESKVIQLVNQERMVEGLRPLHYNDRLYDSARNHSRDMATANYYSHDSRNGRKFFERIFAAGYPVTKCGENIARGFSSPEEVFG